MWMFPILSEGRDNSVLFFSLTWIGLFFLSSEQLWSLCWRNRFSTQDGRYWCKMRFWFIILETQKFLFLLWCSQSCWFHLMWNTSHRISFSSSISVCVCLSFIVFVFRLFVCLFVWLFGCLCFQMHPRLLGHWSTWRVSCSSFLTLFSSQDAEIFERYRDATDDQSKSELLSVLKLRYFTPREVANLHGFPSDFCEC